MKKVYMLILFLMITFMFVDYVDAGTHMWLNCHYDKGLFTDTCKKKECKESVDWNNFFVVNGPDENPLSLAVNMEKFKSAKAFWDTTKYVGVVSPTCWFSEFKDIEEKCTNEDIDKIEDPASLLRTGVCPAGVRQYYDDSDGQEYFRVPAGTNSISIDSSRFSFLEKPEYVLYKFKSWPYTDDYGIKKNSVGHDIYIFEVYDTLGKYGVLFHGDNRNDRDALSKVNKELYSFINYHKHGGGSLYYYTVDSDGKYASRHWITYENKQISAAGVSQIMRLFYIKDKSNYYKVASEYDAKLISIASNFNNVDISSADVTTVFSSDDTTQLRNDILEWYDNNKKVILDNNETLKNVEKMTDLIEQSSKLVDSVENDKSYTFGNYNIDDMLNDLDEAYGYLSTYTETKNQYQTIGDNEGKIVYNEDPVVAANNFITYKYFGTPILTEYLEAENQTWSPYDFVVNRSVVAKTILDEVRKNMDELISNNKIDVSFVNDLKEYVRIFSSAISYLDKYSAEFGVSSEQKDAINRIRTKYSDLANYYDVYVVIDCKGLLGEDLVNAINSVLNIVKFAIPILLIGFGVIDFTKAIFENDESKMNQAQTLFFKRIGIAVLIFFVPIIVNFILTIANEVWKFISPDTCGLF